MKELTILKKLKCGNGRVRDTKILISPKILIATYIINVVNVSKVSYD